MMSAGKSKKRRYPDNGWGGGFGAYMKIKAAKLAKQFDNGATETGDDSNGKFSKIFKGISIYVNGFTDPPAHQLKKLMMMHGGRYIYYPNKSNTTHIVANNLAYTKVKELKNEKVVTPKWITDSVEAGKLLPHAPYLIYRPKASNQSLHRFAYQKRSEREAQKEDTGGNVSSSEGTVNITDKSCSVEPKSTSASMSGCSEDVSDKMISELSPKKKASIDDTGKSGRGKVSSCNVKEGKYGDGGLCEKKKKLLVSEQGKSKPHTSSSGNHHEKKLLKKEVQQSGDDGHTKKCHVPKCKNDPNNNSVNKSGQGGSSHTPPTKVTGGGHQVKNSPIKKCSGPKYKKEEDNNAVHEEKGKSTATQCPKKGVIGQVKNSTEKTPVKKSGNNPKNDFVNKDGRESQRKQHAVKGQEVSSPKVSPFKIDYGDGPPKPSDPFGKGDKEKSCLKVSDPKLEEYDAQESTSLNENEANAPSTQLNSCYFPKSNDPNFLPTFYRHSSFYHLTTWRAEHKVFVKKLQEKGDRSFPGKQKLIAMFQKNCPPVLNKGGDLNSFKVENTCENQKEADTSISGSQDEATNEKPRMIMHIDMDAFFVAVSLLNYPELRGKPVAVAHYAGKTKKSDNVPPRKEGQFERKGQGEGTILKTYGFKKNVKGGVSKEGQDGQQLSQQSQGSSSSAPAHPGLGMIESECDNFTSLAAIASCSYEARENGIRNGMLMRDAKELCPELRTIPYDFDGYHRVSRLLYETVASYTHDITAASCDEVVLDITNLMRETGATAIQIADVIRKEVFEKTLCTASAGLASNIILAKLCTKAAKPNGVFLLKDEDVADFLKKAPVGDLPGIGRAFNKKMHALGVYTCEDLQKVPLKVLQKEFGPRTGEILYQNCRGCDTHHLTAERQRKYVSVEVNYGIRFDGDDDAYQFINLLCREINRKMKKLSMVGRRISLKLKVRRPGTPVEDPKYMGYGVSDDKIRSVSLSQETNDAGTIERVCKSLFLHLSVDAKDIRGVGIQLSLLKKLSKGQAISKSLTEMLPKKEDVPKSPKRVAPPDNKPKSRTFSMLDFVEKKNGLPSPVKPDSGTIRMWSGVPALPFHVTLSQCIIPFTKLDSTSLKTENSDTLLSGKYETAMDIWSKSVTPTRPSAVRKPSSSGKTSGEKDVKGTAMDIWSKSATPTRSSAARKPSSSGDMSGEKDVKVHPPNSPLSSTKNKKTDPEATPTPIAKSPFVGCAPSPTKSQLSDSKFEKSHSEPPVTQTTTSVSAGCTVTPSKSQQSDVKHEKSNSDSPTTTSSFSGATSAVTKIQSFDDSLMKSDPEQPMTLTAPSPLTGSTSTPTKEHQHDTKLDKLGPDQAFTPTKTSPSPGCTPSPTKACQSDAKLEELGAVPSPISPSSGLTPFPPATPKSDTKFQLPPPSELDLSVLRSLPPEMCGQIIQEYSSDEMKNSAAIKRIASLDPNKASTSTGITSQLDQDVLQNLPPEILQEVLAEEQRKLSKVLSEETSDLGNEPTSFSEIDKSCLEALPEDLKIEICEKYKPKPPPSPPKEMEPAVKMSSSIKGEMPLSPEIRETFSHKNVAEKLPWRRNIREMLSMQAPSTKKENLEDGKEMGKNGEGGGEDGYEESDGQGEVSERKEEASGQHDEDVTNLDGAVHLWEVKMKLMEWIDTFESPLDEDVSHVVHYLRALIVEQNLEKVYQVLRALKRIVNKNGKGSWKAACRTITKRIQNTIHQMYGSTLKLD